MIITNKKDHEQLYLKNELKDKKIRLFEKHLLIAVNYQNHFI